MATKRLAIHLLGAFRVSVGPRAIAEREWTLHKAKSLVKLLETLINPEPAPEGVVV